MSEDCSTELSEADNPDDEIWPEVSDQLLDLPKQRKVQIANSILEWLLYFLLIWQGVCHVSDNGLLWLLRFLLHFLKVLNIHLTGELLTELIVMFPTLLNMVCQILVLDHDNYTKYVVCPKYTRDVHGRHVVKRCSSKYYSRRKIIICDGQLVNRVVLKKTCC